MTRRSLQILGVLFVLAATAPVLAASVAGVRLWADEAQTRVVLDLSGPVQHQLLALANPDRLVIDIENAELTAPSLPTGQGSVRGVRSGSQEGGNLRIVLDLEGEVAPRSFVIPPEGNHGHRLVVDLLPPAGSRTIKNTAGAHGREVVVAISPGHGGNDPGAIGKRGTQEKDVVLAIGKRLKTRLDALPGFRGVLVRPDDQYVDHRGRMRRARDARADLFVAIHADAFPDVRARGSTVYVLSERGASSEAARWLANKHNAYDLVGGVKLQDKDEVLASVLLDLSQTASLSASTDVARRVITQLGSAGKVRRSTVQYAGFLVLKSPDIPSILVETAFISNPAEEKRLAQKDSQDKWAAAIAAGIRDYFQANPPPGTIVAANQQQERPRALSYTIGRGDTLSGIAERFNVSLTTLRKVNQIRGDRIRVGQILTIPASRG